MKSQYVADLQEFQTVGAVFATEDVQVRESKRGKFLSLKLSDKTGSIKAVYWGASENTIKSLPVKFVAIGGKVSSYNGELQVTIDSWMSISEVDIADFEKCAPNDDAELRQRLDVHIGAIDFFPLSDLLISIFDDADLMSRFSVYPAAKSMHHAFRGGLLQHSLEVASMVVAICDSTEYWGYDTSPNRDLCVAGALLHDIGKAEELSYSDGVTDYTDEGNLNGHILMGWTRVSQAIQQIPDFPKSLANALLHIIASHHGQLEHGSPKVPMFAEAAIVAYCDDLNVRMFMHRQAREEGGAQTSVMLKSGERSFIGPLGIGEETLSDRTERVLKEWGSLPAGGEIVANMEPTEDPLNLFREEFTAKTGVSRATQKPVMTASDLHAGSDLDDQFADS